MADTKTAEAPVPADWQPGDCAPELTELVRSAFPDPRELEDILLRRDEKAPVVSLRE